MAKDTKDESLFVALGARLAAARNAADMTQVELATALDVPQQTLRRYETGESRIPILTLMAMSRILGFSIDDMLMARTGGRAKRGPPSRLEQQLDAITRLPKSKQRVLTDMLDGVLQGSREISFVEVDRGFDPRPCPTWQPHARVNPQSPQGPRQQRD